MREREGKGREGGENQKIHDIGTEANLLRLNHPTVIYIFYTRSAYDVDILACFNFDIAKFPTNSPSLPSSLDIIELRKVALPPRSRFTTRGEFCEAAAGGGCIETNLVAPREGK